MRVPHRGESQAGAGIGGVLKPWVLALVLPLLSGCGLFMHRSDHQELTVRLPELSGPDCVNYLRSRLILHPVHGQSIVQVTGQAGEQRVTVTYNALRTAPRNIEHLIADAGFTVVSSGGQDGTAPYTLPANPSAAQVRAENCP